MIKSISAAAIILFSLNSFAATSSQCPGEEGYYFTNYKHRNPTKGGFVSNKADVKDTDDMIFIGPDVSICGSSRVSGRARIFGDAVIRSATVKDSAEISENALISNGAEVSGDAKISGKARVTGFVEVGDDAVVTDNAQIYNSDSEKLARVQGKARVGGDARVTEDAVVEGSARINGNAKLSGDVRVDGSALIKGHTKRSSGTISNTTLNEPDYEAIEKARKDKEAYDKKCREEEEARKLAKQAAEIKAVADKAAANAAQSARITDMKNDIIGIGVQGEMNVVFQDNCNFEMTDKEKNRYVFNLTRQSTSWDRTAGKSGAKLEKVGNKYLFVIESDDLNKVISYLKFNTESESNARRLKASFDALFDNCQ